MIQRLSINLESFNRCRPDHVQSAKFGFYLLQWYFISLVVEGFQVITNQSEKEMLWAVTILNTLFISTDSCHN